MRCYPGHGYFCPQSLQHKSQTSSATLKDDTTPSSSKATDTIISSIQLVNLDSHDALDFGEAGFRSTSQSMGDLTSKPSPPSHREEAATSPGASDQLPTQPSRGFTSESSRVLTTEYSGLSHCKENDIPLSCPSVDAMGKTGLDSTKTGCQPAISPSNASYSPDPEKTLPEIHIINREGDSEQHPVDLTGDKDPWAKKRPSSSGSNPCRQKKQRVESCFRLTTLQAKSRATQQNTILRFHTTLEAWVDGNQPEEYYSGAAVLRHYLLVSVGGQLSSLMGFTLSRVVEDKTWAGKNDFGSLDVAISHISVIDCLRRNGPNPSIEEYQLREIGE